MKYSLTISFDTQEELKDYLAGGNNASPASEVVVTGSMPADQVVPEKATPAPRSRAKVKPAATAEATLSAPAVADVPASPFGNTPAPAAAQPTPAPYVPNVQPAAPVAPAPVAAPVVSQERQVFNDYSIQMVASLKKHFGEKDPRVVQTILGAMGQAGIPQGTTITTCSDEQMRAFYPLFHAAVSQALSVPA